MHIKRMQSWDCCDFPPKDQLKNYRNCQFPVLVFFLKAPPLSVVFEPFCVTTYGKQRD